MPQEFRYPSRTIIRLLKLTALIISKVFWFIRYEGLDNIPRSGDRGLIIASNHQTYIDPVWISIPIRQKQRFMAFDGAFSWRLVGPLITYLGAFPVKTPVDTGTAFIKTSLRALSEGAALVIFPEGSRESADGKMMPFKEGTMRIALRTGLPVLPVTIVGGERIWPYGRRYPRIFRRVNVIFHPAYTPENAISDQAATEELARAIASAYDDKRPAANI
ncbi:MAG: 1-acyl-sn-glycerol-3-phosphate acyltransferase [Chloracidobacterium sp.]|nr:1-acyl-sn-glycerol-3-phosphate acyltransferase [Chloracidobacterium sp.]MCC6826288.1 1-acyl-sn-glycerol-3-phosphate acyltransferase [Acidobacteriota bacterium]MCO5333034.1 1-acyl-sn-glycerol-3-phosphate acyltransferase [Pyrinomonadaceae bacterium]